MLAYVFWHWSRPGVEFAEYEARLAEFHEVMRDHPPPGFRFSAVFRGGPAPWSGGAEDVYEDWYLIDGSVALDPLNHGAVNGPCKVSHDAVAALAHGGVAGLYRLRAGTTELAAVRHAAWFSKPDGVSHADLDVRLAPLLGARGASIWMRQMVLGPTPEFCLLGDRSPRPTDVPAGTWRPLRPAWPRG